MQQSRFLPRTWTQLFYYGKTVVLNAFLIRTQMLLSTGFFDLASHYSLPRSNFFTYFQVRYFVPQCFSNYLLGIHRKACLLSGHNKKVLSQKYIIAFWIVVINLTLKQS